jgi:uncharacterized protein DUF3151
MAPMTRLPVGEPDQTSIQEPEGSLEALAGATGATAISQVAASHPACLAAWAALGELAMEDGRPVDAYACFRVGYHRGLDRIRHAGWRGSGRVPWAYQGNRGFLRSVSGLSRAAAAIGEQDEAERCQRFLSDLAPDAPTPAG